MQKLELRNHLNIEFRATTGDANELKIEGIVNPIGSKSRDLGGFREIISEGVFTRAIQKAGEENRDIFLYFNHNSNNIMASVRSNTLELEELENGLLMRATLPQTTLNRDVHELMKAGVISEMSFGFSGAKSEWAYDNEEKLKVRTITDLDLWEVSIVGTGAYQNTKANTRSLEEVLEESAVINEEVEQEQIIEDLQEDISEDTPKEIEEDEETVNTEELNKDTEARAKAVAILECLKLRG